jgi:16S rRNA (adenine1518-N6/adenine1519-N6)-dimethyltransferase
MYLLESGVKLKSITVMVQNEVATRLVAAPGSSDYGAITCVLGYYGEAKRLFKVSRGCFTPAPKVDSAVVKIDIFDTPKYLPKDEKLFRALIRASFEMRRKTLLNAINSKLPHLDKGRVANAISSIGYDLNIRGERLSTADFVKLSDALSED